MLLVVLFAEIALDRFIDWIVLYAVSAIVQPYNGGTVRTHFEKLRTLKKIKVR